MSPNAEIERIGGENRSERYSVVLPCEPSAFGEFIGKLLGKSQSSSGGLAGSFAVNRDDIDNIYHLLDQRIIQQNSGELISFSINIHYDDGTNVGLNSYENYKNYTEIKPQIIKGISLTWIYLISFNNSNSPEKQQVDISFDTSPFAALDTDDDIFSHVNIKPTPRRIRRRREIHYRIQYTNRSWGNDIQNLISEHLKTYQTPLTGWRKFSNDYGFIPSLIFAILICGASIYYGFKTNKIYTDDLLNKSLEIAKSQGVGFAQVNDRLDLLNKMFLYQMDGSSGVFLGIYIFICVIFSIGFFGLMITATTYENPSFILLNKQSQEKKENYNQSYDNSGARFFVALIGSLIMAVIGNIAYYYVAKYVGFQ